MTLRQANRHAKYFMSLLKELPSPYVGLETSRLTVIYFCVIALDIMGRLEQVDGKRVANYVKSMIVSNTCDGEQVCGFIGSSFLGNCPRVGGMAATGSNENDVCGEPGCGFTMQLCSEFLEGHLAMTYSALATLYTLGESFDDLPKKAIIKQLSRLQGEDGCFSATESGSERDLRFLYCACAISTFLDDWTGINKEKAVDFVVACLSYDGGLALTPCGSEGQGGATYCGIAALALMGKLDALHQQNRLSRIKLWLSQRVQGTGGYNGRVNKVPDSCYSFWVGAAAHILGMFGDIERRGCRNFLLFECQNELSGGFGKHPGDVSDILHSFYSVAWLSMDAGHGMKREDDSAMAMARDSDGDSEGGADCGEGRGGLAQLRMIDPLTGVVLR